MPKYSGDGQKQQEWAWQRSEGLGPELRYRDVTVK